MPREQGPIRVNPERRAAARTPPIAEPGLPAEVLRKYRRDVPIRRPAAPRRPRTEEAPRVAASVVEQGLDAARRGDTADVRAEGCELTVRIVPAVRDAVEQNGFTSDEMNRFFGRLAKALGSEELIAKLPEVDGTPGLRTYRTVIGRAGAATIFRFVLILVPETAAVVVLACFLERFRAG